MQNIKITVDVSQIKKKINQIKYDVATLQVNGSKVTLGGKQLNADVKKATAATKELNKELRKTGTTATQSTKQATNGLKAFTTEAKGAVAFTKSLVQSFITPWTIAIVAVEALGKAFKYFWDNLTENIDKAVARGDSAIKSIDRQIKKNQQRTKAVVDLIDKLEELNKLESLSDDQRAYGASLINRLNKEYKFFGITLDEITGKYQGLYQAKMMIDAQDRQSESRNIRKQIQSQRQVVDATIKEVMGSGLKLGERIKGEDLFTVAERLGGTDGSLNGDILAKKWGMGNDLYAIRDVFQQLMDGLSNRSNVSEIQKIIDQINELIDYYQRLKNVNSITREAADSAKRLTDYFEEQRKTVKSTREEIEKLNQQYQNTQKQDAFNALNPKEQVKALKEQIAALEERNKVIEEEQNKRNTKLQISKSFTQERRQIKDDLFAQQQTLKEQIDARNKANIELEKRAAAIFVNTDQNINGMSNIGKNSFISNYAFQKQILGSDEDRKKLRKNLEDSLRIAIGPSVHQYSQADVDSLKKMYSYFEKFDEIQKQIQQNKNLNLADQKQIDALVVAVDSAEKEVKQYGDILFQTERDVANAELERIQNLNTINQKKKQEAQIQKQIAEQERKAAEAAAQNNRLIAQQQQNAEQTLASIAEKGQIEMLRKQGKNKQADVKQRESIVKTLTKQIEGQLGRPLGEKDQALRNSIEAGADIQMALKGIDMQKPNVQNDQVYSNELARMGGFSSSIVVDRMDVSKQILDVNKKANDNLNTIASSVQKIYDNTTL